MAEVQLRKNNTGRQKERMRKKDRNKGLERMKEYDMPTLNEKEEKLLALLFSLCGCCHSTGFVKWKQRINEEGGGGQWWRVRNGRKEGGEKMKTMERKRSAGSKINLLCRAFTQPQTTDMFRQKPGPEEAACLWLMNKVKVSEVYYVNYPRQSPFGHWMKEQGVHGCWRGRQILYMCHWGSVSAAAVPSFISRDNSGPQSLPRRMDEMPTCVQRRELHLRK